MDRGKRTTFFGVTSASSVTLDFIWNFKNLVFQSMFYFPNYLETFNFNFENVLIDYFKRSRIVGLRVFQYFAFILKRVVVLSDLFDFWGQLKLWIWGKENWNFEFEKETIAWKWQKWKMKKFKYRSRMNVVVVGKGRGQQRGKNVFWHTWYFFVRGPFWCFSPGTFEAFLFGFWYAVTSLYLFWTKKIQLDQICQFHFWTKKCICLLKSFHTLSF